MLFPHRRNHDVHLVLHFFFSNKISTVYKSNKQSSLSTVRAMGIGFVFILLVLALL